VSLPTSLRIGIAYRTLDNGSVISLGGARDSKGQYALSSGIEYNYNQNLILRAGYGTNLQKQNNAADGVSFGVGLNLQSIASTIPIVLLGLWTAFISSLRHIVSASSSRKPQTEHP